MLLPAYVAVIEIEQDFSFAMFRITTILKMPLSQSSFSQSFEYICHLHVIGADLCPLLKIIPRTYLKNLVIFATAVTAQDG